MEFAEFDIEFLALKLSENPQSPLFARLADLYLQSEKTDEAMRLLKEGIPLYPNYYAPYIVLGKAHVSLKEYSKAQTAFQKALELSPFNQTAMKLLMAVPNKPDESVRTTDENYFASTATSNENLTSIENENSVLQEEPVQTIFENNFQTTISEIPQEVVSEETNTSFYSEPTHSDVYSQSEIATTLQSQDDFPTHDDYFAQNQHRIESESTIKLDEYLIGTNDSQAQQTVSEPVLQQQEYIQNSFVDSVVPQETHVEPEVVTSSPEQAQLFAEMMGTDESIVENQQQTTDLDFLAEKLQSAEKIVPQENYQPQNPPPQESAEDKAYESDAVTPTLAEIYASQGEFRAAIQAYEILMFSQPGKGADFQKRIGELQRLQMEKDGFV